MPLDVIVLGPPGAGKGTQAELLANTRGIPKISTGDILRAAIQEGTPFGRQAQARMDQGLLVSDDVMIGIVRERLSRPDAQPGFVLDGFPRTVPQAMALDRLIEGRGPLLVFDIRVPEDELRRRLSARRVCASCGYNGAGDGATTCARCHGSLIQRSDDAPEVVTERLRVYEDETRPLVEHYRDRPSFHAVDGNKLPERVAADLAAIIDRPASREAAVRLRGTSREERA
jgi:adenylate kinase